MLLVHILEGSFICRWSKLQCYGAWEQRFFRLKKMYVTVSWRRLPAKEFQLLYIPIVLKKRNWDNNKFLWYLRFLRRSAIMNSRNVCANKSTWIKTMTCLKAIISVNPANSKCHVCNHWWHHRRRVCHTGCKFTVSTRGAFMHWRKVHSPRKELE